MANGVHEGSVEKLLRLPVRVRGIQLGRPVDLVLDRDARRGVGLEVICGDDEHRFLPLAVGERAEDTIEVRSPLLLLARGELTFYTSRGSTFASLRGKDVLFAGEPVGTLSDLVLAVDGAIESVVVATHDGSRELPFSKDVTFGRPAKAVRAAS
jgi:sporulation protein YlmC with PRC-barrel domain